MNSKKKNTGQKKDKSFVKKQLGKIDLKKIEEHLESIGKSSSASVFEFTKTNGKTFAVTLNCKSSEKSIKLATDNLNSRLFNKDVVVNFTKSENKKDLQMKNLSDMLDI